MQGYCGDPASCPGNNVVDNKCPGGQDNKCCLSVPYQEPECEAEGGACVDKCGCEGEVLHGFCPNQPNSIKCCKVAVTTTESGSEEGTTTAAAVESCVTEATNCVGGTNTNCNNGVCTVTCNGSGGGNNNNNNGGGNNNNNGGGTGNNNNGGGSSGGGSGSNNNGEEGSGSGGLTCPGGYNTNCNNGVCQVSCSGGGSNNNNNNNGRRKRKRSTRELCED